MLRGFLIKLTALDGQLEDIKRELTPSSGSTEYRSRKDPDYSQKRQHLQSSSRLKTTLNHQRMHPATA